MPPRNRALLRIGIELRGATSDATPRVSPTIFSRQPEKQTWISFKTLKISAGYDPALTPALETRTVSKYEGKFIYSYLRNLLRMKVSSLTFGRQCDYHTNPGRLQIRHALRAKHLRSRVFFFPMRLVRPSQDGERTVPLANMLFGAKNANIAQHLWRLDCHVHEETPRPLKLTHGRSIALWSKDQISATDFAILTLMTKHRCRTRWEHSKSEILLDDNARHDPRSPSLFGAQQHLCKRSSTTNNNEGH